MKYVNTFKWLSVILVVAVMITAIGCGKKEAQKPTPTPTTVSTPTATAPAEPTGETGTLSSLTGNVTVMRQGTSAWIAATSGMKLGTGDSLKTGGNSSVIITFFDGSVMEVRSDSEISVEELSKASGGATTVHINQVIGNTVNRVKNLVDSSSTYEVETPAGSAVVRGTIYEIQVDESGRTCTGTVNEEDKAEHSVGFTGGGVTVKIGEGMTSCCEAGGIPGTPFYTDSTDDPLQFNTGDGLGASGGVRPTPTPIACPYCEGTTVLAQIWSLQGVSYGPTAPSTFTLASPARITEILTYHWQRYSSSQTIALQSGSQTYGPWSVDSYSPYWYVHPDEVLPAGTYTVIDSQPSTWSWAQDTGGRGIMQVSGCYCYGITP